MSAALIVLEEYAGLRVPFDGRGWFCATRPGQQFGKEPNYWLTQRETVEYVAALAAQDGISGFVQELNQIKNLASTSAASRRRLLALVKQMGYIRTQRGPVENGGGTWMHPKLAVPFARWLDATFAVWCDGKIAQIIRGQDHTVIRGMYAERLAFEARKTRSEQKGSIGGRMLGERRREKGPLDAEQDAWEKRMEPGLFGQLPLPTAPPR